jgi:hypothetical protein
MKQEGCIYREVLQKINKEMNCSTSKYIRQMNRGFEKLTIYFNKQK